jgi:hypothetical protein
MLRTLGLLRVSFTACHWPAVTSGSVREVDPFGATVVLFTMRVHIGFDAWLG